MWYNPFQGSLTKRKEKTVRRIIAVLLLIVIFALPAFAQITNQDEKIVVKKSDLTAEQLEKVQAREKIDTVKEVASEVSSWGKEAGVAFNAFVGTLTDQTVRLSSTEVGKFAMFMIAWKVMAKDVIGMGDMVVGYLVGVPLLFVGCAVLIWSYRRQCLPRRMLIEKTKDGGRKYAIIAPNGEKVDIGDQYHPEIVEGRSVWAVGHVIVGALFIIACSIMIFGC